MPPPSCVLLPGEAAESSRQERTARTAAGCGAATLCPAPQCDIVGVPGLEM